MLNDYTVAIIMKNKDMESISERTYSLASYCKEQKNNLSRLINDVEEAFTAMNNGKDKSEWSEDTVNRFMFIRRNILNSANNIGRLPSNIKYKGVRIDGIPTSEFIANIMQNTIK